MNFDLRQVPLFAGLDEASRQQAYNLFQWVDTTGGQLLIEEGTCADAVYLIVAGRFDVCQRQAEGQEKWLRRVGPGDVIGEIAVLSGQPRTASVRAVRDGIIGRLSAQDFLALMDRPGCGASIARVIASCVADSNDIPLRPAPKNVAVVLLEKHPRTMNFVERLLRSCRRQSLKVERVTSARVDACLGPGTGTADQGTPGNMAMMRWLYELEEHADVVLLIAEPESASWTRQCVRQADRILLVADSAGDASFRPIERMVDYSRAADNQLVLLHPPDIDQARGTPAWLDIRGDIHHHHVRDNHPGDVDRCVRLVLERGIGLAFSGASSRAPAHLGVVRAMAELGIPIDCLAGTSSGSAVAGFIAIGMNHSETLEQIIRGVKKLGVGPGEWQPPFTSLTSGATLEGLLRSVTGDRLLEDQIISAQLQAFDLYRFELMCLRRGPVWKGMRASMGMPCIYPPVANEDELLVDGGLVDNMPLEVLLPNCHRGLVIGSDLDPVALGGGFVFPPCEPYGATLSGWQELLARLLPWRSPTRSPTLMDVIVYCMCIPNYAGRPRPFPIERRDNICIVRPPIPTGFGIFGVDVAKAYELEAAAYKTARRELIRLLDRTSVLPPRTPLENR